MKCIKCGGRGFIESFVMRDNRPDGQSMISQCCDVNAYSIEILRRNRLGGDADTAKKLLGHGEMGQVLEFRRPSAKTE